MGPSRWAILRQCVRNDPFDLCYEDSSPVLRQRDGLAVMPRGIVAFLHRFAGVVVGAWRGAVSRAPARPDWSGKVLFLATSANHKHALKPVADELGVDGASIDDATVRFLRLRAALYALPFLPVLLYRCIRARPYQRETLAVSFAHYWTSYGAFLACCEILARRPALLVLSSDHASLARAAMAAARTLGIPTAFIPHAGVTKGLPALAFDYAFLDGLYAAERYAERGRSSAIQYLAGTPRLDPVVRAPRVYERRVGMTVSLGADTSACIDLMAEMAQALPAGAVIVRPHPREPDRVRYVEAAARLGCVYSDARTEPIGEFLSRADIVICGDSNIILEAKVAGSWVVFFDPRPTCFDQYGYLADGLPNARCRTTAEVANFVLSPLTQEPPPAEGLDRFMATIGTPWLGKASVLVAQTLLGLANIDRASSRPAWRARPGSPGIFLPPMEVRP